MNRYSNLFDLKKKRHLLWYDELNKRIETNKKIKILIEQFNENNWEICDFIYDYNKIDKKVKVGDASKLFEKIFWYEIPPCVL